MGHRYQWLVGIFAVALLAMAGVGVYNAGVAHGLSASGTLAAAPSAAAPVYGWYPRPWGFGFGFFPFFPFLLIFFWLFVMRGLFWSRRHRRGYGYGCGYPGDVPPAFDEWHRRAHAQQNARPSDSKA